ncbi:MAG: hypothetical protein ACLSG5_00415 [Oscillospiraceae bacterium]
MTSLCRTKSCGFTLEQCHELDEVRNASRSGSKSGCFRFRSCSRRFLRYPWTRCRQECTSTAYVWTLKGC